MGWDVVAIGLKHNLPVHDMYATAQEVSRRLNRNIRLFAYSKFEYDPEKHLVRSLDKWGRIDLGTYKVDDTENYLEMEVADYQAGELKKRLGPERLESLRYEDKNDSMDFNSEPYALYEILGEDDENEEVEVRIFRENMELGICFSGRWHWFEKGFHESELRNILAQYRNRCSEQAQLFGCRQVLYCSDQGPTALIYDQMDWSADALLEYAQQKRYAGEVFERSENRALEEQEYLQRSRQIEFQSYFDSNLQLGPDEIVDVVYDTL